MRHLAPPRPLARSGAALLRRLVRAPGPAAYAPIGRGLSAAYAPIGRGLSAAFAPIGRGLSAAYAPTGLGVGGRLE